MKEQLRIMKNQLNVFQSEVRKLKEQIRIRRDVTFVDFVVSFTKRIQKLSDLKEFIDEMNLIWKD